MSLCIVSPHFREPGEARAVVGPWETQNSMLLSFYLLSGQVRLINISHLYLGRILFIHQN